MKCLRFQYWVIDVHKNQDGCHIQRLSSLKNQGRFLSIDLVVKLSSLGTNSHKTFSCKASQPKPSFCQDVGRGEYYCSILHKIDPKFLRPSGLHRKKILPWHLLPFVFPVPAFRSPPLVGLGTCWSRAKTRESGRNGGTRQAQGVSWRQHVSSWECCSVGDDFHYPVIFRHHFISHYKDPIYILYTGDDTTWLYRDYFITIPMNAINIISSNVS